MKNNLTGRDLLIMHSIIMDKLSICNLSEGYRDTCIELENKIVDVLDSMEIELKKPKRKK